MKRSRVRLVKELLELAEEEGGDLSLEELYKALGLELPEELEELLQLPPRVVVARDPKWASAVRMACEEHLKRKLQG